jgi:antitoxin MazE
MRARIQKWGNSLALRIPKPFAIEVGFENETDVEIIMVDGKLVIAPVVEPGLILEQLLAKVTGENLHHEVDTGRAAGKEAW